MQSEERHELKQNDLQEFLANFGEFWKQWGNSILIVITLAVIGFAGYRIYNTRMQTRYENTWADLALTSSPASFAELGESLPYPAARAVANLNGADLYLQEATNPSPAEAGTLSSEEKLNRAEQLYQAALDEDVHEALRLNALVGLAEVAVARQQFDAATEQFEQIAERAGEAYPVHAGIARQRLNDMDRLRNPVPLAEDPAPTPEA
ncbi:MAG: tetratricopeptide repeat protein, partial [Planctomycetes bacterium]|nr:tetratricopeptide repeat protein [Planctomycetota bacterium]